MRKIKGASLVDYILPTAIVGIVLGLGIYSVSENNMLLNFLAASANLNLSLSDGTATLGKTTASQQTNTENPPEETVNPPEETVNPPEETVNPPEEINDPYTNCSNGTCTIDFGDFVLTGIPENLNEIITASGTSGGTDTMASVLMQISSELQTNGDAAGSQDYKNLANLAHLIADEQEAVETFAKNCSETADTATCLSEGIDSGAFRVNIPATLTSVLPNANKCVDICDMDMTTYLLNTTDLGIAKHQQLTSPATYEANKTKYASQAALSIAEKIYNDTKYSDTLKSATKAIVSQINDISSNLNLTTTRIEMANSPLVYRVFDLNTGTQITAYSASSISTDVNPSEITNPQTSVKSDVRAALTCIAGKNQDVNYVCK